MSKSPRPVPRMASTASHAGAIPSSPQPRTAELPIEPYEPRNNTIANAHQATPRTMTACDTGLGGGIATGTASARAKRRIHDDRATVPARPAIRSHSRQHSNRTSPIIVSLRLSGETLATTIAATSTAAVNILGGRKRLMPYRIGAAAPHSRPARPAIPRTRNPATARR